MLAVNDFQVYDEGRQLSFCRSERLLDRYQLICAVCILVCSGSWLRAAPNDHFGFGVQRQATAGGTVASRTGGGDVLENPALLTHGGTSFGFGVTAVFDRSVILLMRRPTGYAPTDYENRLRNRSDYAGALRTFVTAAGQHELIENRLYAGVAAVLPVEGIARIQARFANETEQYFSNQVFFARFGPRLSSEIFSGGLGYRFSDSFSFGIGFLFMPQVMSTNNVYTPNAVEPSSALINVDTQNGMAVGTIAGLNFSPVRFLRFGLAFRDEIKTEVEGRNLIQISGADEPDPFEQAFVIVPDMLPLKLSVGARGEWSTGSFVEIGGAFVGWGNAVDDHGASMGMQDVVEGNLAAGVSFDEGANEASFGVGWRPSPTPTQNGRTNYVDNDRVVVSAGGGHRFKWSGQSVRLGVAMQLHLLLPEQTTKLLSASTVACDDDVTVICDEDLNRDGLQTGNPGFPGFSHGGHIMTVGFELEWYLDE